MKRKSLIKTKAHKDKCHEIVKSHLARLVTDSDTNSKIFVLKEL